MKNEAAKHLRTGKKITQNLSQMISKKSFSGELINHFTRNIGSRQKNLNFKGLIGNEVNFRESYYRFH